MLNLSESLSEKFVKRWAWLYLFSFILGPIWYIVKIILSNDLRVEEIWILYWIIWLVTLLTVYHDLGLTESLNYFLPKFIVENNYNKFKSALAYAMLAQIPTSLLIGSILFFSSDYLSTAYFHSGNLAAETSYVLKVFSLFFIWMNLFTIANTVYWATQNTKYQKWTEIVRMLAILGFTIFYWINWDWTLYNYSWTWIYGLAFGILFSYVLFFFKYYLPYLKEAKIYFDKELFLEIFRYAIWVLLAANVGTILSQLDMQLIIYILWPREAWYYTNYLSIIWIPFLIITPIFWFLFPVISELNSKNDHEKIKTIKTMFYKYFSVMAILVSWFAFVFAKEIATILYSEKFIMSWVILQYSIFFLIFNFLLQINFQILAWIGRIKDRVKILGIGLIINFILNLILINYLKQYWLWAAGSSLAVGLSWIPIFYLSNSKTIKYSWKFDYRFFLKNLFVIAWTCLLMYFFAIPKLILLSRLQLLFYILLIWFFYIIFFVVINVKELKLFYIEIKKIREK